MNAEHTFFFTRKWPVFYEDNHLLVVYKPSGLLIQGDSTNDISLLDLAKQWIKLRCYKPGRVYLALVHRLDRPVAGVTVFARTSKAASRLGSQFRSGEVKKGYFAVVEGKIGVREGELVDYIERQGPTSRIVEAPTGKSRQARLFFKVIEKGEKRSFVEIDLLTGRHHQIRAQLANMGYPVAGDLRYGASTPLSQKQIALFAGKLSFTHPVAKETMNFASPLPAGWPWPGTEKTPEAPPWNWAELSGCLKKKSLF